VYQETVAATLEALDHSSTETVVVDEKTLRRYWPPISWPPWGPGNPPEEDHKARAQRLAKLVVQFERELAQISLDLDVLYQDPQFTYNPLSFLNFSKALPEVDFTAYLSAFAPRSFPDRIIVSYPPYIRGLSRLIADTKPETMFAYFVSRSALSLAENLGSETGVWKAHRSLQEVLRGLKKGAIEDRADFCLRRLENALGFAAGRFFVKEAFGGAPSISRVNHATTNIPLLLLKETPKPRQPRSFLVWPSLSELFYLLTTLADIIDTFKDSLSNISWMDSLSAEAAAQKVGE
jgi:endothelin-converting enzyme